MRRKEKLLKAMKKSDKKNHRKKERINEILEIPVEVVSQEPKITKLIPIQVLLTSMGLI